MTTKKSKKAPSGARRKSARKKLTVVPVEIMGLKKQAGTKVAELGSTGLKHQGGVMREEFLRELDGDRAVKTYREMWNNSAIIGAIVDGYIQIIRELDWGWQPGVGPNGEENAEFVEGSMHDMSATWNDTLSEIMSMVVYGWTYMEVVFKRRMGMDRNPPSKFEDGRWGWRKWAIRAQETLMKWEIDDEGGIKGMWQRHPTKFTPIEIPIEKALLFRTTNHKGNPEGRSLLRSAYISWYNLKNLQQIEAVGIERNLNGLPVAWVPPEILSESASSDQVALRKSVEDTMANIRNDEQSFLLMPQQYDEDGNKMWDFQLATSQGSRVQDTTTVIQRMKQDIAQSMMFDILLMGHEKVGSFALSRAKMQLAAKGIDAVAGQIEQVCERIAAPSLLRINGMSTKPEDLPEISRKKVEFTDLEEIGKYIQALAGAGAPLFPDDELENRVRSLAGLPDKPEDSISQPILTEPEEGEIEDA